MVALIAVLAIVLIALQTSPVRNYLRDRIVQALADNNIGFSSEALDYNPLALSTNLSNVRITSPDLPDAPPFLEIARLHIDLSPWALARGRYVVQDASADGVRLHYFVNADGVDNLPRPPSDPDNASEPIDYLIEHLHVPDAAIRYENHASDIDITVPRASLTMEGHALTNRHDVTIDAPGGNAVIGERALQLEQVNAALDLGKDDVRITRAELVADGTSLAASGSFGPFDAPVADIDFQASIDAARAASIARIDESLSGQVGIEGNVKGPIAQLTVDASINGRDVQFRELHDVSLDASGTYTVGGNLVRVSKLNVTGPVGKISADGQIAVAGGGQSRLKGSVEALRAEPLMRSFDLPYRLATRVDGRIDATWPGLEFTHASGNAQLSLTPTADRATASTLPLGGAIDVTGRGNQLTVTLRDLVAAQTTIDGRIGVADGDRLSGNLQLRTSNVGAALAAGERVLGKAIAPMTMAGALTATASLAGTTIAPVVTASLSAPSLAVGDADRVNVGGDVVYRSDRLNINRLDVVWREARATARGTVGLTGSTPMDLSVRANALPVAELLRAFEQRGVPASGTVSAQAQIGGTAKSPIANIHVQGADLAAYHETFGTLTADARYASQQFDLTNFALDKPQPGGNGRLTATGSYQTSTRRFTLDADSSNIKLLTLQLPDGRAVTGGIDLQAKGAGTIGDPSGRIDVRANSLMVGDAAIGNIVSETTLADAAATTVASAARFGLNLKSTIGVSEPYPATVTADVSDLDLTVLPLNLQTPLEGTLRAHVEAEGPLSDPQSGRASATIQRFAGSFHQQPFQVEAPAELRYADERLTIDQLRLQAQDSHVAVTGNLPLLDRGAPGTITIDADANLATLVQYLPVGYEIAADGRMTLNGTLQGTLKAIDPNLSLAVENALVMSPEFEPGVSRINLQATIDDGIAEVTELTAAWGAAQIEMSGRVPLDLLPALPVEVPRPGGPATLHARLDNLDPGAIPGAPSGLSGKISGDVDVESPRPDWTAAEGKIAFRQLLLGFEGLTLEQQGPSTIALRNGIASVEQFRLGGSVGNLAASGSVALTGERPINLDVTGGLNIAAISIVTDQVRAEGDSTIDVTARGTVASPVLSGNVTLTDGTVVVDEPRIAAEAINARVLLDQNRINLTALTADVNGGTLTGKGGLAVGGEGITDVNLELATRDFAFDAPLDLRSISDANITITSDKDDDIIVGGQVTIEEGGLTGDINFDTGLLASITSRRQLELTPQRNPLLERVLFNVNVDTASPILVDNNLAKAEVTTDLRVVGTPYEPGMLGRLQVAEGGLVTLNERTYEIRRGQITFIEDRRIVPSFDLQMTTSVSSYDVTLGVTGEPGDTDTTLTSSPALPEPDIMAMLVTGRTLDQMRGAEYDVAREQVLSYLTGRVGSTLGRGLERATGLSEVRIEPEVIANEADPGARLTLGQDITDDLSLAYSVDLTDSDDQIWLATYDVTRRFQTRGVRQADNSYRFDFRHDVRFGGRPEPRRVPRVRPKVASLSVPDDTPIPANELRDMLGVEQGDDFDYFAVRNGTEDIEQRLREGGWAQSRVRLHRDDTASGGVALTLAVDPGPQVEFSYAGATPPGGVQDDVRLQWQRGVFDAQRTDDTAEVLREWLMGDKYLQAKVNAQVDDSDPRRRRVRFEIVPGPRSRRVLLTFEGAAGISGDELDDVINEQDLTQQLFTDPVVVTELLKRLYRERGYLNADIDKPRYEFDGEIARIVVPVHEGPQFTVSDVAVRGNSALAASTLLVDLPVETGDPFLPTAAANALQHIRDLYWQRGYNEVRIGYQLTVDRSSGKAGVTFTVNEGRQAIVSAVRIAGNDQTSDRLVREQVMLQPGQPLNLTLLSQSRKNLYNSGAFSVVDLSRDTIVEDQQGMVGAITGVKPTQKPVSVDIAVREVQPFQVRYGASYDTEGKLGGVVDASLHNVLGKARVAGLSARYDAQVREGRVYMSQPMLRHWPIQTTASVYYRDERNPATSISDAFNVDRRGASIQQERTIKDAYIWNYGYRFEQARSFSPTSGLALDHFTRVSPLTSAFVRDTRDEVLDATRGSFSSHAFAYSPKWLGSSDTYMKYFGQYFRYFPLQPERRKRFSNEIIRPRLVFATGARIGLSKGFGTFVPTSERFFAGGSTTLRGFEQNAVGAVGAAGVPIGGDAMLLLNNELRVPLVSIVDGVGFLDVGNVWQQTDNFSFTDLRKTAGFGLRLRTKWVLVRGDYGFILDRRPGERRGRFYFSIGQAF